MAINETMVLMAPPPVGLKKMFSSFVHSVKRLSSVLVLTAFLLCIFAVVGLEAFMGSLGQKCISSSLFSQNVTSDIYFTPYYGEESTAFNYREYLNDPGTML